MRIITLRGGLYRKIFTPGFHILQGEGRDFIKKLRLIRVKIRFSKFKIIQRGVKHVYHLFRDLKVIATCLMCLQANIIPF